MLQPVSISVDPLLIARCFLGLIWGVLLAVALDHTQIGKVLAHRYPWLAVIIGIGIDLIISYAGDWWTVVFVIALSSIGVIVRSLLKEEQHDLNPNSYKLKQRLEDAIAVTDDLRTSSQRLLEEKGASFDHEQLRQVATLFTLASRANELTKQARKGE